LKAIFQQLGQIENISPLPRLHHKQYLPIFSFLPIANRPDHNWHDKCFSQIMISPIDSCTFV